jgi:hypothetical protein
MDFFNSQLVYSNLGGRYADPPVCYVSLIQNARS